MPIKKKKKKKPPIYPSKNKMTVDGFYDYITRYMSPEDALKKLLISSLGRYEKLKFEEGKEVHPEMIIAMAAMDLGWGIVVETGEKNVNGLVLGTTEYVNRTIKEAA